MVGICVMFGLQSLLMHTQCKWFPWGRNCQHPFVSQPLHFKFPLASQTWQEPLTRSHKWGYQHLGHLHFLHQPFWWIGSRVPQQPGEFVWEGRDVIHTVGTSGPGLCKGQIKWGWNCLQGGHSWNTLVYSDQGWASDKRWQPIMQYFLLLGNCECFVYVILNCIQCVHCCCFKAKQTQNMSVLEVRLRKCCCSWVGRASAPFICARPGSQALSVSRFTFFPCCQPRQSGVRQGERGITCEVT